MKKLILLIIASGLIYSCGPGKPNAEELAAIAKAKQDSIAKLKIETLDDLGKQLLLCVKANDFSQLTKHCPTLEEIVELLKTETGYDEKAEKEQFRQNFDQLIKTGTESGVLWKEAEFSKVGYETRKQNGVETSDLAMFFKYRGMEYQVYSMNCVKVQSGWKFWPKMGFGEYKSDEQIHAEMQMAMDSIAASEAAMAAELQYNAPN